VNLIDAIEAQPHLPCDPMPVVNGLRLRKALGRHSWQAAIGHGCCGWRIDAVDAGTRIIVTGDHASGHAEGVNWIHASISHPDEMPEYEDLKMLHRAVFGPDRWSYQVFAPEAEHVNIHAHVLHLFGRADGRPALPNFGRFGTI